MHLASRLTTSQQRLQKNKKGDCHRLLKLIQNVVMIADFTIDHPALLLINCKISMDRGERFSSFQKNLSLFVFCLFVWCFGIYKKLGLPPQK
jgi:hypothetical protein